ncbi:MAG: rRNA maturation RNase YbeY [Gammaproteobacteria bacterium]|nr:rRNA maturation RNase YbeY [Gammaproteobacteria bacterium]
MSAARRPPLAVDLRSSVRRGAPAAARVAAWARAALGAGGRGAEVAVRVVGLAEGRRLNLVWRGRDYATNVLSFPVPPADAGTVRGRARGHGRRRRFLGDIVLCAPVVAREARRQRKAPQAHWAHLVVHGCLHLAGLDHERAQDARRMERRERRVLAGFGFPDPYLEAPPARAGSGDGRR